MGSFVFTTPARPLFQNLTTLISISFLSFSTWIHFCPVYTLFVSCVCLPCSLYSSSTSLLILFSSGTILHHLPTPSLCYVKKSVTIPLHISAFILVKWTSHAFSALSIKSSFLIPLFMLWNFLFRFCNFNSSFFWVRIARTVWSFQMKSHKYVIQWH